jgi:predicted dehydrogenase
VIGLGSIGRRHRDILTTMGLSVAAVSRRGAAGDSAIFATLEAALDASRPGYVVVATETSDHEAAVRRLAEAGFTGRVLVEKPLFGRAGALPNHRFAGLWVGYPLRFDTALIRLGALLARAEVLSAEFSVGQYLPDWRPGRDYRRTASALAAAGGGALRDLSHELDLACWLLGPWQRVAALGGHWSALDIDSDDVFVVLARFERCRAATIQLNYLDRRSQRRLVLNTRDHTYSLDLIAGTLQTDALPPEIFTRDRDARMIAMHRAVLSLDAGEPCRVEDGLLVDRLVEAAERAAATGAWVVAGAEG